MIIAQISDTHIDLETPDAELRIDDFRRTIADINALDPIPDLIVHTGDIVHNGRADEYAQAAAILAAARAPVYVLAGNKDDRANLLRTFADDSYLPSNSKFIDYAVESYPVRLIAVDTLNTQSNKGDFCPERERRLLDMIGVEQTKPIVVFSHHPPFLVPDGPVAVNFETPQMMERLSRTLQRSDRIIAVISGHVHRSSVGRVGDIPAVVMPSTATTLRWGHYPADMKSVPVYHVYRYDPAFGFGAETRIVAANPSAATVHAATAASSYINGIKR